MPILRLSQHPGSGTNKHHIAVEAEVPVYQRLSFSREIEFALSPQDGEKIRWYLEDYLQFAQDPAPQIASRVETLPKAASHQGAREVRSTVPLMAFWRG